MGKRATGSVRCFLSLAVVCLVTPVGRGDDRVIRKEFSEEYTSRAEAIQRHYTNIEAKCRTRSDAPGSVNVQITDIEAKYNLVNFLIMSETRMINKKTEKEVSKVGTTITCRNARYSFDLKPKPDQQYVVTNLAIHDPTTKPSLFFLAVPYADFTRAMTFVEMAHDEATRFLSWEDCVWQKKPMKQLKVQYTFIHPSSKKPEEVIVGYYFSPQDGWICCGRRSYPGKGASSSQYVEEVYTYKPSDKDEFPLLSRVEQWLRDEKKPNSSTLVRATEISEFRHSTPFPDSDFRLSAFGLPEPPGMEWKTPTPWWLWSSLVGAALLVVGAVFYRLKRRSLGAA